MHELLKQLKEAGFPQKRWCEDCGYEGCNICLESRKEPVEPTTDELIEGLGDNFYRLYRRGADRWVATTCPAWYDKDTKEEGGFVETKGESMKEALVKLYIEVNKQK